MDSEPMKVACAVIEDGGRILAAQRSGAMSMPLKWEFPGGKVRPGESPEECLAREVEEELGLLVRIVRPLPAVVHRYPGFTIELLPFFCAVAGGGLRLNEHSAVAWLAPAMLREMDWAAADIPVVESCLARLEGGE